MQLFTLAYRPGLSTEMAALIVVDDLFLSIIKKNMYVLELLDFSSASYQISRSIF